MRIHKATQHYSESFRRMVIEEYLRTGIRKADLLRKYHIKFKGAIYKWMQIYQRFCPYPHRCPVSAELKTDFHLLYEYRQ